jgi:hypothetical protein
MKDMYNTPEGGEMADNASKGYGNGSIERLRNGRKEIDIFECKYVLCSSVLFLHSCLIDVVSTTKDNRNVNWTGVSAKVKMGYEKKSKIVQKKTTFPPKTICPYLPG